MIPLGKIVLGMAGVGLLGAGVLCSEGLVHVKVVEKQPQGFHINVIAPAMLAPIAVHFTPRRNLEQAARQVQPYMPVVRAAIVGLRDSQDIVFVDVKEPGEHVHVSKSGGSIVLDVDGDDATVHVSAPIRAISSTVEQLAAVTSDSLYRQPTAPASACPVSRLDRPSFLPSCVVMNEFADHRAYCG